MIDFLGFLVQFEDPNRSSIPPLLVLGLPTSSSPCAVLECTFRIYASLCNLSRLFAPVCSLHS